MIFTLIFPLLFSFITLNCAGADANSTFCPPSSADKMDTKKLEQSVQLTTGSGCTFTAEKGWFVTQRDSVIVVEDPDRELIVTLLENQESTAQDAVAAAWKKINPDFAFSIQHTVQGIANDGWGEIVQFVYDTPKSRFVFAVARRVGGTWYLELIDGSKAAFDRRIAGVLLIDTSFKIPGMAEESFTGKEARKLDAAVLKELSDFVENAMVQAKVPGAAIAIVQDGKIIFEEGFGLRMLGKPEKVTPQTLFMIGSTTKALTTFMMARLVDEGMFRWNTPVTQVMPDFALGDAETTQQVLMKHMVSASTGMPRHDIEFLFNYDQATPSLRLKEMRHIKPTTGFGETFQYSNGMVSAGGYIAAHSVNESGEMGKRYDAVMQARIFDPIGMHSTTFDFAQVESVEHAIPHSVDFYGSSVPFPVSQEKWVESVRPAGGAWSNVGDMARYMITELNKGINADGKRVISTGNVLARYEPQIKISDKWNYGLGLMLENDHGVVSVGHGGITMGFNSMMFFLPEYNVGLVMLTNTRGAGILNEGVKRKFMELLFDGKALAQEMVATGIDQQDQMLKKELDVIVFKPDAAWLKPFVGAYISPVLGQISIRNTEDGVELDARVWRGALGQKKAKCGADTLIVTSGPFAGFEFLPQYSDGTIQLVLESGQHKYVFERQ